MQLIGSAVLTVHVGLIEFAARLKGLAALVLHFASNLQALVAVAVLFDIGKLLQAKTGLELFIDFILVIGLYDTLSAKLATLFATQYDFFVLITNLGGNSTWGVDGLFGVPAFLGTNFNF